jgi:dolichol-phosphate mannosyltransferase
MMEADADIRLINRRQPAGFGRAIRSGLSAVRGDVIVICMADLSDDPQDIVAYYRKIEEGYDCVFGSRFMKGARVEKYPPVKLVFNRIVNWAIQWLFWTDFNDLTNAFKAYRTEVVYDCGPYRACHFNITIEMSLSALIRNYRVTQIPIRWYGRTWGSSKLKLTTMGRRYLSTLLMMWSQHILISDDLLAEREARNSNFRRLRLRPEESESDDEEYVHGAILRFADHVGRSDRMAA